MTLKQVNYTYEDKQMIAHEVHHIKGKIVRKDIKVKNVVDYILGLK